MTRSGSPLRRPFLLGAIAAAYHFRRSQWIAAAAWGLLVGLTRPNGFLLSAALAIAAWSEWRKTSSPDPRQLMRPLLVAAMPALGMLAFTVYLWQITGIWFAWRESHLAWGRTFQGIGPIAEGISFLESHGLLRIAATRSVTKPVKVRKLAKTRAPNITTKIDVVVRPHSSSDSDSVFQVSRRRSSVKASAPADPIPAASVGVQTPK